MSAACQSCGDDFGRLEDGLCFDCFGFRGDPTTEVSGSSILTAPLNAEPNPHPRPSPSVIAFDEDRNRPEIEELIEAHRDGYLMPVDVALKALPRTATQAMRTVRDDFALIAGLRLAVDDDRPVPYGCAWAAERLGLSKRHVARVLSQLVACGVLDRKGNMPGRGRGKEGTRLYAPGTGLEPATAPQAPGSVERRLGTLRGVRTEPETEPVQVGSVPAAEIGVHRMASDVAASRQNTRPSDGCHSNHFTGRGRCLTQVAA